MPNGYVMWQIIKTIEANFSIDYLSHLYQTEVEPLRRDDLEYGNYQIHTYLKEPDNPFKKV